MAFSSAENMPSEQLKSCMRQWLNGIPLTDEQLDGLKCVELHTHSFCGSLTNFLYRQAFSVNELHNLGEWNASKDIFQSRLNLLTAHLQCVEVPGWILELKSDRAAALPKVRTCSPLRRLPVSIGSAGFDAVQSYIIKGYLPENSLCSIYGPSGSFKTFFALSWACHIATGQEWAGKRVADGAVLYVMGEGGIGVKRRIRAWETRYGKELHNFRCVNCPVCPTRQEELEALITEIKRAETETGLPVKLVVFDTVARCFGGGNENETRDMAAFVSGCDAIRQQTGATVLLVHHTGKDAGKGPRGSSVLSAALDAEYLVRHVEGRKALTLCCTKMKDADEPGALMLELVEEFVAMDADGERQTSLVLVDLPLEAFTVKVALNGIKNISSSHVALFDIIAKECKSGGPVTVATLISLMKNAGIDTNNVRRLLKKLETGGAISIDGNSIALVSKIESEELSEW